MTIVTTDSRTDSRLDSCSKLNSLKPIHSGQLSEKPVEDDDDRGQVTDDGWRWWWTLTMMMTKHLFNRSLLKRPCSGQNKIRTVSAALWGGYLQSSGRHVHLRTLLVESRRNLHTRSISGARSWGLTDAKRKLRTSSFLEASGREMAGSAAVSPTSPPTSTPTSAESRVHEEANTITSRWGSDAIAGATNTCYESRRRTDCDPTASNYNK